MNLLKIIEITGAIASISAWVLAYTQWNDEGQIKSIVAAITGIILGILAIWAHRVKSKSKVDMLFETLSDELYVEPQPANLKVECVRGKAEIRILEEKEDHFKLKAIKSTFPILKKLKIRWIAKGELID